MTWTTSKRWAGFVGGAIAAGAVLVAAGTPRATEGALAQAARVARIAASDDATAAELGWSVETLRAAREARGASNAGLLQSSAVQRGKALKRIGNPKPEAAPEGIRWRAMALLDENGEVPEGGLLAAKAQMDAMRTTERILGTTSWTSLGPGNVGGRIRAIAPHPSDADVIFIGSVSGGIWRTTDAGASWNVVDDFMASLAVTQIVFDPTNEDVMYASTGEGVLDGTSGPTQLAFHLARGAGVFRSVDGGTTWAQLPDTATSDFFWTNRVAISPDGATLLAATESGVWRSIDDGGTWTQETTVAASDVDFDPTDSSRAVAGDRTSGEVRWSDDGGDTWTAATGFTGSRRRIEVAWSSTVSGVVYASVYLNSANGNGVRSELWRSSDGGQSFDLRNSTVGYLASQGWYDNVVWVSPFTATGAVPATADDEVVIVGGVWLWRSADGGTNLAQISNGDLTSPHADNHMIVEASGFDGLANARVYFGTDGGIFEAPDVFVAGTPLMTTGWLELNNTLSITQFYAGAGHAGTETLIGGTQDNGTNKFTPGGGSEGWTNIIGSDGTWCSIDPADADNMFGGTQNLRIFRSNDGGTTPFVRIDGAGKAAPFVITDTDSLANFIPPSRLDPNDLNVLWAGGASLWRTTDSQAALTAATGPTWRAVKGPTPGGSFIYNIEVMEGNGNVVWVTHNNGDVYSTADALVAFPTLPTWTKRDDTGTPLPNRVATSVKVDPADANRVYVTFGGFASDNLWVTTDGGATWGALPGLPAIPLRAVEIDTVDADTLYVGSELGVIYSVDAGQHWQVPNSGPANVSVDDLIVLNGTLYAATHGRGWFKQTPAVDLTPPIAGCTVAKRVLWPATRGLVDVGLVISASDEGDPSPVRSVAVYSDEANGAAPYTPDATVTTTSPPPNETFALKLRAERVVTGNGRVYVVSTAATDANGNVGRDCCTVFCPANMTTGHLTALFLDGDAAEAACESSGTGVPGAPWNNVILAPTAVPSAP